MLPCQSQVPSGKLPEKNSTRNSALNFFNLGDDTKSFAALLSFAIANIQTTFLIPTINRSWKTKNLHDIPQLKVKHNFFESSCNRLLSLAELS